MKSTFERTNHIEQKLKKERAEQSRRNKIILAVSSCAAAFLLMLSLVLFLPFPTQNIAKYKDSEYYAVICKLDELHPRDNGGFKNNFELMSNSLKNFFAFGAKGEASNDGNGMGWNNWGMGTSTAPTSPGSPTSPDFDDNSSGNRYEEVTNNQVEGVIEGDLFKRSSSTVYYLRYLDGNYLLDVYPLAGLNTQKSATLRIAPEKGTSFSSYTAKRELYLSADATRALVLTPCYHKQNNVLYTAIVGIDLTGETPMETGRVYVSGDYVSSRLVNGKLLLVSNFRVNKFDYDDEKQYLPQTGTLNNLKSVPMDSIILPEEATTTRYTVLSAIDSVSLEITDTASLMSYSEEVYVSENHVFASLTHRVRHTYAYAEIPEGIDSEIYYWGNATKISCLTYGEKLELAGTVNVNGSLYDRYSMDEYEGVLRVFTTTQTVSFSQFNGIWYHGFYSSASLYCYSLADFSKLASVENFAPEGESVYGARFRGKVAYVCTAKVFTDPVFAFDLSDYNKITFTDTGTISGYSLFLTPFTDDTMVGIGYGDDSAILKIELYEEGEGKVDSVAKVEVVNAGFAQKFKAYFIDKQNGLVGLATRSHMTGECTYLLYRYDGYHLVLEQAIDLSKLEEDESTGKYWYTETDLAEVRATLVDGVFYIFTPTDFIPVEL